jgi:hypothetical protein
MKKEYFAGAILGLFVFGYVLDYFAGPLRLTLTSPYAFFTSELLNQYPFTAVSILIKTIAVAAGFVLIFSFFERQYFVKAVVLFCVAGLFELYAIQQVRSGAMMIPLQWILALTASGVVLLIPTLIFLILGIVYLLIGKLKEETPETSVDNGFEQ